MKVGISTHVFARRELTGSLLRDIAAAGFKALELWCSREHLGYHKPGRVREVFDEIRACGLELVSLHAPFYLTVAEAKAGRFITLSSLEPSVRETARREIETLLGDIRTASPIPMVLHTGLTFSEGDPRQEENFLQGLQCLLPLFRQAGLLVAIENGPRPATGCDMIAELVRRVGSEDVGICLDTGHSNIAGSLLEDLALCAPHLLDVHVHDNDGANDQHLLPFGGSIPWADFTAAVKETGYGGPFMMETAGDLEPGRLLREIAGGIQKLGFPRPQPPAGVNKSGEPTT